MAAFKWAAGAICALLHFAVQQLHFHRLVCLLVPPNTPHSHSSRPLPRRCMSDAHNQHLCLFCGPYFTRTSARVSSDLNVLLNSERKKLDDLFVYCIDRPESAGFLLYMKTGFSENTHI